MSHCKSGSGSAIKPLKAVFLVTTNFLLVFLVFYRIIIL